MKLKYQIFIFIILCFGILFAQNKTTKKVTENKSSKSFKIDARPFLMESEKKVTEFLKNHPDYYMKLKLEKRQAWNFSVGTKKAWFASNLETNSFYSVPSTCRAVGTNCYIFVEDAIWNTRVTQSNVDAVKNAFDNSTPVDPNKGIYQIDTETFGNPPDVDNDPKIIILILDIKDGYNGSGGFVAGYFHSVNEVSGTNSNMAEIYYLDADPTDLSTQDGLNNALSTMAHEFQHMIHFNYHNGTAGKPVQITFLNEGCSTVAEVICGYPVYPQSYFNNDYNEYLFIWRNGDVVLNDYSRAARYTTYMYEQFGADYLKKFVQSSLVGVPGINDALSKLNTPTNLRFKESLENWFLANILNDKTINVAWGYSTSNINTVNAKAFFNPNYNSGNITVEKAAADYLTFQYGKNLSIKFNDSSGGKLKYKVIKYLTNNNVQIDSLTPNTQYDFNEFGTTVNKISFAILNPDISSAYSYSFTSKGEAETIELAYDESEPTGVLQLSDNDTVCVVFDGVNGANLDSIRVALRQAGSVHGGIYEYTGAVRPSPLGKVLVSDLTVTSNIDQKPPYPYPVPWPNWITADLSSFNINASNPFVVAFVVEGTYPQQNRIMVTEQPNTNNHSFTYLSNPSSGTPGWYILTNSNSGDSVFTYLIRAYLSFPITAIDENDEPLATEFQLYQNYPNPFNPTTTIKYEIPVGVKSKTGDVKHGMKTVKLTVYDVLGREVATLVNKRQSPGRYSVTFNAFNLPSGLYFYKLTAGEFSQTKKMILMK